METKNIYNLPSSKINNFSQVFTKQYSTVGNFLHCTSKILK